MNQSNTIPNNCIEINVPITRTLITEIPNMTYSQVWVTGYGNICLRMNILKPQSEKPVPAIIFVTGGRFLYAKKENNIQNRIRLAEAGFLVASIEYRVAPIALFPAPVEDIKSAIRYLRSKEKEYNIDTAHIGVYGQSAGGYIATMAGTTNGSDLFDKGDNLDYSSDIHAVVDLYGVTNLDTIGKDFSKEEEKLHTTSPAAPEALFLYGADIHTNHGVSYDAHKLKESNPMTYISDKTPPFLIMHGGMDDVMSVSESEQLNNALKDHNIESSFYFIKNGQHGGMAWVQEPVISIIIDFFSKHLK